MKTWQAFVEFQNDRAYGGVVPLATDHIRSQMQFFDPAVGRNGLLIVGPGGPSEVGALHERTAGPITTLSAHAPEVAAISEAFPHVHAHMGDMHEMPFEDEAFDALFCSNVLEHAVSPIIALMEFRRVLKHTARAHLILPSFEGPEGGVGPFHWFCMDQRHWSELLRKVGLPAEVEIERGTAPVLGESGYYMHFRCTAGVPIDPYDQLAKRVKELRAQ